MAIFALALLSAPLALVSSTACSAPEGCAGVSRASLIQRVKTVQESSELVIDSDDSSTRLLGSIELFQEKANAQTAERVAQDLAAMYVSTGTPEVARLANKMLELIAEKRSAVRQAHQTDVDDLQTMLGRFTDIANALQGQLDGAKPFEADVTAKRQAHVTCRDEEAILKSALDLAESRLIAAKAVAESKRSEEMRLFRLHQASVEEIVELNDDNRGPLKKAMTDLATAIDAAIAAEVVVGQRQLEYDAALKAHGDKLGSCNLLQAAFEQSVCTLSNTWDLVCAHYSGEYESRVADYAALNQTIARRELDRHVEWEWIEKVRCAVELLNETSRSENGAVHAASANFSTCFSKAVDTSEFNIIYTPTPAPQPCPAVAVRPCSVQFLSDEYGQLPKNAPAAACSASCSAEPTPPPSTCTTEAARLSVYTSQADMEANGWVFDTIDFDTCTWGSTFSGWGHGTERTGRLHATLQGQGRLMLDVKNAHVYGDARNWVAILLNGAELTRLSSGQSATVAIDYTDGDALEVREHFGIIQLHSASC